MIERTVERLFFASRWLLAPVYLGLSIGAGGPRHQVLRGAVPRVRPVINWSGAANFEAMSEADVVLSLLALVDFSLVAGLRLRFMEWV